MRNNRKGFYKPLNPHKIIGDPNKIYYRSSWEKVCMNRFDLSEYILKWGSEVIIIPYLSPKDNRIHRYFMDFVIVTGDKDNRKVTLIEVKPKAQTKKPRKTARKSDKTYLNEAVTYAVNIAKWKAAEEYCKQKGFTFLKLTEDEIFGRFK